MYSSFTVIGTVIEAFEDRDATIVIVRDGIRDEKAVACRFWGKGKAQAEKLGNGDLVLVEGYPGSRKYKDKYYTDCNASFAKVIERGTSQPSAPEDAPPAAGESDLPF